MNIAFATSRAMDLPLLPDTIQRDYHSADTAEKRQPIRGLVTLQSLSTIALSLRSNDTVMIIDCAVKQIENVSAKYRRQTDHSPVLAQARNAECVRYDWWEDAEEEAVG